MTDALYRFAYRVAYQLARTYWRIRRPCTHGALVIVWKHGRVLLVRNSYVSYYSPPGGYVHRGESARDTASRELKEEVGVAVDSSDLRLALEVTHEWEFRHDHVTLFDIEVSEAQVPVPDAREVVAADFFTPDEALLLNLFPPVRQYLESHVAAS
ncbi:MAG: NUDIX domain-containing protein [Acidimicrobiia bacterium]